MNSITVLLHAINATGYRSLAFACAPQNIKRPTDVMKLDKWQSLAVWTLDTPNFKG